MPKNPIIFRNIDKHYISQNKFLFFFCNYDRFRYNSEIIGAMIDYNWLKNRIVYLTTIMIVLIMKNTIGSFKKFVLIEYSLFCSMKIHSSSVTMSAMKLCNITVLFGVFLEMDNRISCVFWPLGLSQGSKIAIICKSVLTGCCIGTEVRFRGHNIQGESPKMVVFFLLSST